MLESIRTVKDGRSRSKFPQAGGIGQLGSPYHSVEAFSNWLRKDFNLLERAFEVFAYWPAPRQKGWLTPGMSRTSQRLSRRRRMGTRTATSAPAMWRSSTSVAMACCSATGRSFSLKTSAKRADSVQRQLRPCGLRERLSCLQGVQAALLARRLSQHPRGATKEVQEPFTHRAHVGPKAQDPIDIDAILQTTCDEDPSVTNGSSIAFLFNFGDTSVLLVADAHASVLLETSAKQRCRKACSACCGRSQVPSSGGRSFLMTRWLSAQKQGRFSSSRASSRAQTNRASLWSK